jgi:hypothetical protein
MTDLELAYKHILLTISMLVMRWNNFKDHTKRIRYTTDQHWRLEAVDNTINELLRTKDVIHPPKEEEIIDGSGNLWGSEDID